MYCPKCGNSTNSAFCEKCGSPLGNAQAPQPQSGGISCPKCGSSNVNAQVINEVTLKNKHHGFFWWIFIGWWWIFIKWLFFTIPALIVKIFSRKKQKAVNKKKTMFVCQSCGNTWEAK